MTGIVFVYVTHPELDAAVTLATRLVEDGLVACANILPGMISVYRWEGRVEAGGEAVMILKTTADIAGAVEARVREDHPYVCPCVAVLPVTGGSADYLDWIARNSAPIRDR